MSKEYYWRVFGKTEHDSANDKFLEVDHWPVPSVMPSSGLELVHEYLFTFEKDSSFTHKDIVDSIAHSGDRSFKVVPPSEFSPKHEWTFHGETNEYQWVRASVWVRMDTTFQPGMIPPLLYTSFQAHGRALKWQATQFDTSGYVTGEWRKLVFEVISPISLYADDYWIVQIWNPSKTTIYVDDFHIEVFEPVGQSKQR
jgi:hypothetical protein